MLVQYMCTMKLDEPVCMFLHFGQKHGKVIKDLYPINVQVQIATFPSYITLNRPLRECIFLQNLWRTNMQFDLAK
jgi:hypothetical protein